jgi:RimJ/RimL family protein N-acetyltransferase
MKVASKKVTLKNGTLVTLRSAGQADAGKMLEHLRITHSESYRNLNQSAEHWHKVTVGDEEKVLAEFERSPSKFMIITEYEERIVGGLGFMGFQAEFVQKSAAIGMSIQKAFCDSGLGTEMMTYMIQLAKEAGFRRIELTVRTYNTAGIALYEKVGFQRIGLLKDAAFIDGEFVDEYSYQQILKS